MNLEQSIRDVNIRYTELSKEPTNLYKQFQYYSALQEQQKYMEVIR